MAQYIEGGGINPKVILGGVVVISLIGLWSQYGDQMGVALPGTSSDIGLDLGNIFNATDSFTTIDINGDNIPDIYRHQVDYDNDGRIDELILSNYGAAGESLSSIVHPYIGWTDVNGNTWEVGALGRDIVTGLNDLPVEDISYVYDLGNGVDDAALLDLLSHGWDSVTMILGGEFTNNVDAVMESSHVELLIQGNDVVLLGHDQFLSPNEVVIEVPGVVLSSVVEDLTLDREPDRQSLLTDLKNFFDAEQMAGLLEKERNGIYSDKFYELPDLQQYLYVILNNTEVYGYNIEALIEDFGVERDLIGKELDRMRIALGVEDGSSLQRWMPNFFDPTKIIYLQRMQSAVDGGQLQPAIEFDLSLDSFGNLSPYEIKLLELYAGGNTTQDISGVLGVSDRHIRQQRTSIIADLGLDGRRELFQVIGEATGNWEIALTEQQMNLLRAFEFFGGRATSSVLETMTAHEGNKIIGSNVSGLVADINRRLGYEAGTRPTNWFLAEEISESTHQLLLYLLDNPETDLSTIMENAFRISTESGEVVIPVSGRLIANELLVLADHLGIDMPDHYRQNAKRLDVLTAWIENHPEISYGRTDIPIGIRMSSELKVWDQETLKVWDYLVDNNFNVSVNMHKEAADLLGMTQADIRFHIGQIKTTFAIESSTRITALAGSQMISSTAMERSPTGRDIQAMQAYTHLQGLNQSRQGIHENDYTIEAILEMSGIRFHSEDDIEYVIEGGESVEFAKMREILKYIWFEYYETGAETEGFELDNPYTWPKNTPLTNPDSDFSQ